MGRSQPYHRFSEGSLKTYFLPKEIRQSTYALGTAFVKATAMIAKTVADFRPIVSTRIFYNLFAYMLLARMDPILDDQQPEEQHGLRAN